MEMPIHPEQAQRRSEDNPRRDWPRVVRGSFTAVLPEETSARRVSQALMEELQRNVARIVAMTLEDAGLPVEGGPVADGARPGGLHVQIDYGYNAIHIEVDRGAYAGHAEAVVAYESS